MFFEFVKFLYRPLPACPSALWALCPVVRLLPSRVGFAERDASRPAFGGSSLIRSIDKTMTVHHEFTKSATSLLFCLAAD